MQRKMLLVCLVCMLALWIAGAAAALVDLEWRPTQKTVMVGDQVKVDLYAVADHPGGEVVSAMDVIVTWDPALLSRPTLGPRQSVWMSDGFSTNAPGGINYDLTDGDVMYTAWATLGVPAAIDEEGLLCVEFYFTALAPCSLTDVRIVPSFETICLTRVFDGTTPNKDIKGTLGSATISILSDQPAETVASIKALNDGAPVSLQGPVVTRSFPADGFFYVEDADRTAGIRVDCAPESVPVLGSVPFILGSIATVSGERVIQATSVTTDGITSTVPRPIGMSGRSTCIGLLPQGLLVTLWGRAGESAGNLFLLDDGSPQPVQVRLYGPMSPAPDTMVTATGVLGWDEWGPVLRVNAEEDIIQPTQ